MKKFLLLVVILAIAVLDGNINKVDAEDFLTSSFDGSFSDGNTGGVVRLTLTPQAVATKYDLYYIYVPSEINDTLTSIAVSAYKSNYDLIQSVTLTASNTASGNVYAFTMSAPDYGLYMYYMAATIDFSEAWTSGVGASMESTFDTYGKFYFGSSLNIARLPDFNTAQDDTFAYDEGFDDAEAIGNATAAGLQSDLDNLQALYDDYVADVQAAIDDAVDAAIIIEHTDAYNEGLAANMDENFDFFGLVMEQFFQTFTILGIELMPNLTIGMIVSVPIILGLLSFILGVATASIQGGARIKQKKDK